MCLKNIPAYTNSLDIRNVVHRTLILAEEKLKPEKQVNDLVIHTVHSIFSSSPLHSRSSFYISSRPTMLPKLSVKQKQKASKYASFYFILCF